MFQDAAAFRVILKAVPALAITRACTELLLEILEQSRKSGVLQKFQLHSISEEYRELRREIKALRGDRSSKQKILRLFRLGVKVFNELNPVSILLNGLERLGRFSSDDDFTGSDMDAFRKIEPTLRSIRDSVEKERVVLAESIRELEVHFASNKD